MLPNMISFISSYVRTSYRFYQFVTTRYTTDFCIQRNPDFTSLQGKRKLVRKIAEFEKKSRVKIQCLTEEGKRLLVRVIGRFEKLRVREIGIPL